MNNDEVQNFWVSNGFEEVETKLKNLRLELNASDFVNPGDVEDVWQERNELKNRLEALVNERGLSRQAKKSGLISKSVARRLSDAGFLDRNAVCKIMLDDLADLERFRKSLEKSSDNMTRKNTIETFNLMGVIGTLIFASAAFLANCVWIRRCNNSASDDSTDLFCNTQGWVWGSFGLHPFFMSAAFLLCAPAAACAHRVMEGICHTSHTAAMIVHVVLQLTTAGLAWAGVTTAWISNETNDEPHFSSSHCILGGLLLSVYATQILTSLFIYICGSKELRASFHILHMAVGQGVTLAGMFVASMGILYFETESYSNDWDESGENGYWRPIMTVTQYCIICAMFSMVLLFYGKALLNTRKTKKDTDKL